MVAARLVPYRKLKLGIKCVLLDTYQLCMIDFDLDQIGEEGRKAGCHSARGHHSVSLRVFSVSACARRSHPRRVQRVRHEGKG